MAKPKRRKGAAGAKAGKRPLKLLEANLKRLNNIVKARGGKHF